MGFRPDRGRRRQSGMRTATSSLPARLRAEFRGASRGVSPAGRGLCGAARPPALAEFPGRAGAVAVRRGPACSGRFGRAGRFPGSGGRSGAAPRRRQRSAGDAFRSGRLGQGPEGAVVGRQHERGQKCGWAGHQPTALFWGAAQAVSPGRRRFQSAFGASRRHGQRWDPRPGGLRSVPSVTSSGTQSTDYSINEITAPPLPAKKRRCRDHRTHWCAYAI